MIEINLLPEEARKKKKKFELPEIPILPLVVFIVAALALVQVLLGSFLILSKKELSSLEKKWQEMKPKKAQIDELKKSVSIAGKKAEAIEELVRKRQSWSRLLNDLSSSVTPNIWLNELRYDEKFESRPVTEAPAKMSANAKSDVSRPKTQSRKMSMLTISGSATGKGEEGTTYVARFIQALKDNRLFFRNFDDIELVSIKTGSVAGYDVMNFILICRFKPEGVK